MKIRSYIFLLIPILISFLTSCISRENMFDRSLDEYNPDMILAIPGGGISTVVFVPITETYTINNKGEIDLQITGLVISEGDITQFEIDRSNFVQTVKPGKST